MVCIPVSNIDDVELENDDNFTNMRFILQVRSRKHLAQIMRELRHIREIGKLSRVKKQELSTNIIEVSI